MLWVKAFHVIFMVTWFAGLFYLPRLFVYHAMSSDEISVERFKVMERKLFYGITTPGAVLTLAFGAWLLGDYTWDAFRGSSWLHAKLALVSILAAYHLYLGKLVHDFNRDTNHHGHVFYRWLNEFPVVILVATVILVIVRPF
jgi:protoporphyrinogen IX oxidase